MEKIEKLFLQTRKGQITIIAIIIAIITIMVFGAVLPVLNTGIGMIKANTNDTAVQAIADMYPLFLALGIVIAILTYTTVQRPME